MKRCLVLIAVISLGFMGYASQEVFANGLKDKHSSTQEIEDTSVHASSKDVYLMAELVQDKAQGEPFEAQVAIVAVVLNRVKSPSFPNTITRVVSQIGTSVSAAKDKGDLSGDAMKAVHEALDGYDPSRGGLYFNAENEQHPGFKQTVRIDDFVFYK